MSTKESQVVSDKDLPLTDFMFYGNRTVAVSDRQELGRVMVSAETGILYVEGMKDNDRT